MAQDLRLARPGYLDGAPWVEHCSTLSKDCTDVGTPMCLRSRHFGADLRRALRRAGVSPIRRGVGNWK